MLHTKSLANVLLYLHFYLVVKLRITPPNHKSNDKPELTADQVKKSIKANDEKDSESVLDKTVDEANVTGYAYAPYWPMNRRSSWWLFFADDDR
ncbi:secretory subunit [Marasmius sp. AFHP31]|nr:secretory subunit [Marasmius sp. AFHP31]